MVVSTAIEDNEGDPAKENLTGPRNDVQLEYQKTSKIFQKGS